MAETKQVQRWMIAVPHELKRMVKQLAAKKDENISDTVERVLRQACKKEGVQ